MYLAQVLQPLCADAECAAKRLHAENIGQLAEAVQWAGLAIAAALVLLAFAIFKALRERDPS